MSNNNYIPAGFKEINVGGLFISNNGPLYATLRNKQFSMGMVVEQRHCNPHGICHGGMLSTFADMLLPYGAMYALGITRRFTPTISLQLDFLAPANLGSWIEGTCEPLRSTSNLLFVQGLIKHKDEILVRASGLFKWGDFVPSDDPLNPFGLEEN
ncbi:PaaI family thioesterase [Polynucleobacter sp. IMCC 29146]|uniref:PaaI family thioesterase n=1 Tax=Polynucleobacter sp. IMCC 29146 TaxID=2780953 RepID=UPI001F29A3A5|nr:PaaI family thioesterase [Polynucleobacter sp. IMCC 29146]MCE7530426.1 PaaI family thioesterase [Polynucleobacter sp. IMCC 29146]